MLYLSFYTDKCGFKMQKYIFKKSYIYEIIMNSDVSSKINNKHQGIIT